MSDLSNPTDPISQPQPVSTTPSGAKEVEPGNPAPEMALRDVTGHEVPISQEVASAGIRVRPTTISIPPKVSQMGVKPAGSNVPVQTTTTIVLPLTDDQIALGLQQSITNSLRWLSEWCVRRLKQMHVVVKEVHGKLVRSNA
jgi:hypothetical protein